MKKIGERVWNIEKLFNLKAGLGRADDTLPPRMLNDPLPSGFAKGGVAELDVLVPQYYETRGWDESGIPTSGKLAELGLN